MKLEETLHYDSRAAVIQNLKDAGCTQEMIDCVMMHLDEDDMGELLKQLERHRSCLLGMVHEREKQIDCLDYLVYQIQRNRKQKK
ncbi:MAG: hypothetical protein ACOYBE_02300 [Blautia sp.]